MGRGDGFTWLELTPQTGRTHQLRVHCQAMGWPILGDPIYGDGRSKAEMLHLHARAIIVPLYKNKAPITVEAPPPKHMMARLELCGYKL
jgi:tRNA pseudouridine32 synthase/23S rRNA pseudouridine746 synthase